MSISTCAVTGTLNTNTGMAITDATVSVRAAIPFYHSDGTLISGELCSSSVDSSGNFSISVVETETVEKKLQFTLRYSIGHGDYDSRTYVVTIPNTTTATLSSLVT